MTKIVTRYEVLHRDDGDAHLDAFAHPQGAWVKFEDIKHLLGTDEPCRESFLTEAPAPEGLPLVDAETLDARITEMSFKAKAGEPMEAMAVFDGGAVKAFAVSMVNWFRETGGKNYVTCDLRDPETGEQYQITMQKAGGRTPAQDLAELRSQLNWDG